VFFAVGLIEKHFSNCQNELLQMRIEHLKKQPRIGEKWRYVVIFSAN